MHMNMAALKELAENLLSKAMRFDKFNDYVEAMLPFSITIPDGMGGEEECVSVKMEAIYDYYRKNPDCGIEKQLYDELDMATTKYKSLRMLVMMLRMIEYQLMSEKTETAPFKIDVDKLLLNLKNNLQINKSLYSSSDISAKSWAIMERHNVDLMDNYGRKIM